MNLFDSAHGEEPLCKMPGRLRADLALTGRKTPAGGVQAQQGSEVVAKSLVTLQHMGLLGVSEYGAMVQMAMGGAVTILTCSIHSECAGGISRRHKGLGTHTTQRRGISGMEPILYPTPSCPELGLRNSRGNPYPALP